MENLGFIFALAAALAWGSYMVPFKQSKATDFILFQALMGVAVLVSGVIISLVLGYSFDLNLYGILAGGLWAVANLISLTAVANLGLSKGIPFISSLVILSSFLWGAIGFGELPDGFLISLLAIGIIITGVVIISTTGGEKSHNLKKGLIYGVLCGIGFGSYLVPVKIGQVAAGDYYFSMCLGVFGFAMAVSIVNRLEFRPIAVKQSLLSGVIWNLGNLTSVIAVSSIGLSKAFPVTQVAVLIAVLWGIFYFKEVSETKQKRQVILGALVLLVGVIILGLS